MGGRRRGEEEERRRGREGREVNEGDETHEKEEERMQRRGRETGREKERRECDSCVLGGHLQFHNHVAEGVEVYLRFALDRCPRTMTEHAFYLSRRYLRRRMRACV